MRIRFTPRQLDAFVTAAELGGFTQTASKLNLSASAVSSLIGELEAAVGFALFERTTRKVSLTAAGRDFLPSAMAVLRQIGLAELAAADVRDRSIDVIRICAPQAVAAAILPPAIAQFQADRPRVRVRILDTGVEWLADRVANAEADLALGPDRSVGAAVACEPLAGTAWVVWCAPNHPLAAQTSVRWSALRGVECFAAGRDHEGSVTPILGDPDESFTQIHIVENVTTALGLAAANLGVTLCPDYVVPLAAGMGLVSRPMIEPSIERQLSLYTPTRRPPRPEVEAFAALLRSRLRQVAESPLVRAPIP